ncbi:hypothetical protein B296_00056697 [Ensete ventricosum]|uniref:Uncharacterized protein n=1 Tax=Ensete ventricosum TaxID=4639 RepID=A0A426X4S5_ENSVE|nr:hypothetical protein B296_00056697 [Ensete ventricosum]
MYPRVEEVTRRRRPLFFLILFCIILVWFGSVRFDPVRFGSVPFGPVTIDFDNRRSISGGINQRRKKKRESKKREKMEIIRSGVGLSLLKISSPCAGRKNVSRKKREKMKIIRFGVGLPPRAISSPCTCIKNVSPCRGSNEVTPVRMVTVRFGSAPFCPVTIDFDNRRFISGGINCRRKKKWVSKKREMEIIRSGVGLPPRAISSPCADWIALVWFGSARLISIDIDRFRAVSNQGRKEQKRVKEIIRSGSALRPRAISSSSTGRRNVYLSVRSGSARFDPVSFGPVTIDFDNHRSISGGINRERKKRESKKREKMEIISSGVGLPSRAISSPCAGRKNVSRVEEVTRRLQFAVRFSVRSGLVLSRLACIILVWSGPVRFDSVPFGPVTIDFGNRRSISGGINRGRKKESKKREMEIIRSGVGLPPQAISSPCAGRKNVSSCRKK